jgi:hypothetical protein
MVSETDTMITLPIAGNLTYREWHGIIDGLYCGVQDIDESEYTQEKHYWRIGWLIGDLYDQRIRDA